MKIFLQKCWIRPIGEKFPLKNNLLYNTVYYIFHHVGKGDDNHDNATFRDQVDELTNVENVHVVVEFARATDKIEQVFAIYNYICYVYVFCVGESKSSTS